MPRKERILVVDDSKDMREVTARSLTQAGYAVAPVPGVAEAIRALGAGPVDLVITDVRMPKASGMDLLRHVRESSRDTDVIIITGYATVPGAVEAMSKGAVQYLAKPFTDTELLEAVRRALARQRMMRRANAPAEPPSEERWGLIGESPAMLRVYRAIEKAARGSATVLISGESGTGKELAARAIHYSSARRTGPFVPVNCGGIPDPLLASELFGHRRGAFTGAIESRPGFFHAAEGGSLFLDEIAELAPPLQSALLRALQDKEVTSVGSREPRKINVRIIAATNRNLEELVDRGGFRRDLYYRVHVIPIELPPLRDREDDILLLAREFTRRAAEDLGKPPPRYTGRAIQMLRAYPWPGNVRELENMVQRLVLMSDRDIIDAPDLPALLRRSAPRAEAAGRTLADVEADYIREVLDRVRGNKSRAAEILGIDRKTLRQKLRTRR